MGITVATVATVACIALAVRLRYSAVDYLSLFERKPFLGSLLILPAFIPIMTIVALLARFSRAGASPSLTYFTVFFSHFCLHYPIYQFIGSSLIASIDERHVLWQRQHWFEYFYSLYVDGFRRHLSVIGALVGLGIVQVVTDGAVSRWFSTVLQAPEEALQSAVYGRLSSPQEAMLIVGTIVVVGLTVSLALAAAFVLELRKH
jgi:hypothetical protein